MCYNRSDIVKEIEWLKGFSAYAYQTQCSLAKRSTIGCGGVADVVFTPQSVVECVALLADLEKHGIPYFLIGNGSNLLPPDGETSVPLVDMRALRGMHVNEGVFAYAGVSSGDLLSLCKRRCKGGAEFLTGIPCTIGGAVFMNAGADGRYMSEIVESVLVYRRGKTVYLPVSKCKYGYKQSVFMESGGVILGAAFRLTDIEQTEIERRQSYYKARRAHLPQGKSMGCVFKNPPDASAGALIEKCGLKGKHVGGAYISPKHANFIINEGNASSKDVKQLVQLAKDAVYAQCGVCLHEEIRYIPT